MFWTVEQNMACYIGEILLLSKGIWPFSIELDTFFFHDKQSIILKTGILKLNSFNIAL